jgi:tetratricopeptide (TPR) repeat protein
MSENLGNTEPSIPIIKPRRGRAFLFNAVGLIVVLILAVLAGYGSGLSIRRNNQSATLSQRLGDQFKYALVDIQFQHYANAKQRLEYIIARNPTFPGAQEKLTEVLVLMNQPTPTLTPSLTPTPDFSGAEQAFSQAQQLIAAQDWPSAIGTLDQIRKLDPTYKTGQVDGMYYFALRNYGYDLITKQGNLEGGIYQFTLAERFGPLDRDSTGLREGARYYLIGASFWELDWEQALSYFNQIAGYGLWDGTMTVSERIHIASMRYGDQLLEGGDPCGAVGQYENAQAIGALDKQAQEGYHDAFVACYPPTPTIDLTLSVVPVVTTEVPPAVTTEPPPTVEATTAAPPTDVPTETPTATP